MTEAEVTPVSAPQEQFDIVGEWLWSSDLRSASEEQNQLMFDRFEEMGVTDIYLLVKGTNGTVAFNKTETALQKDDPDRDILEEAIELAHARGIRLHAWITSANDKAYKTAYRMKDSIISSAEGTMISSTSPVKTLFSTWKP